VSTVLIGAPEHLPKLLELPDLRGTTAFSDDETLRALDVITRERPAIIALERTFAASSRGVALINRIKADPALIACEIRIVATDTGYTRTPALRVADAVPTPAPQRPAPAEPVVPLDLRGTRRAARTRMADGLEVLIDGTPAALVDLSPLGAQVVSTTALRPNQRLRVTLPGTGIRVHGAVAWAAFEIPKAGPRYRAGIEFVHPDARALEQFCAKHKK
jgi:hypothetical protein